VTQPGVAGSLAGVLPSAAALLSVPGCTDVLGLTDRVDAVGVRGVVVLLVDGLGWQLLCEHAASAPLLSGLAEGTAPIAVGFPSTTATSLASLGTGTLSGQHGIVGYTFALPGHDGLLNALRWDAAVDPLDVQPLPTVLEAASADGVRVSHVGPRAFEGSGLTRAALRGACYPGAETLGEVVAATAASLSGPGRALTYVYTGDLDNVGHVKGCGSLGWRAQLEHVDLLARHLRAELPPDGVLLVTADHGMVDVDTANRVDFDLEPELQRGVLMLGGEPRARHVYAQAGAAGEVLAVWQGRLGGGFDVLARQDAVDAGWFGPLVSEEVLPRIGDVLAVPRGAAALVASRSHPREARLVGYHGSRTEEEVLVPLLVTAAGRGRR
jgi:Type I phosphodiesterase / nucleotide pyrophosphatase